MAKTMTEVELLRQILKSFNINNERYLNKTLQTTYINLSINVKRIDRVDNIANIIYGFSEEEFISIKRFFGLLEEEEEENEDYFSGFVQEIKDKQLSTPQGVLDDKFSEKFSEHIRLCCFQRDFMMKISQTADATASRAKELAKETKNSVDITIETISKMDNLVERTERVVENTNKTADEALKVSQEAKVMSENAKISADNASRLSQDSKNIMDEVSDTKTSIYGEFIAILGVFTAIAFVLMGSIQTFGTVFSKVDNPSSASMGYAVEAGAVFLIIIITIVIVLFTGMNRVLSKSKTFPWWVVYIVISVILLLVLVGLALLYR